MSTNRVLSAILLTVAVLGGTGCGSIITGNTSVTSRRIPHFLNDDRYVGSQANVGEVCRSYSSPKTGNVVRTTCYGRHNTR